MSDQAYLLRWVGGGMSVEAEY